MKSKTRWNNYAIDGGHLQLPNLLITHHEELGIDEKELMFLIKLSAHKDTFKLHDEKVVTGCQKTAQRRRKSLRQKGLLDFTETTTRNSNGEYRSEGFIYDLSKMNTKLQELSNNLYDNETKMSDEMDLNVTEDGHQRPPNNNSYNNSYNNSSSTATARETSNNPSDSLYIEAEHNIQTFIPSSETYCLTPKDKKIIDSNSQIIEAIKYWKDYAFSYMKDVNGNKIYHKNDIFDKYQTNNTSILHVIEQHWNNFSRTFK